MRVTPHHIEYLRLQLAYIKQAKNEAAMRLGLTESVAVWAHREFELAEFIARHR